MSKSENPDAGPEPATDALPTFDTLPLSSDVRQAVDELGYTHPTPVQRAVFEPAARGADLVVQARTGTGKTAAFGLPIVDAVVRKGLAAVQAIALCPTRELALQVARELEALGKHRGVRVTAIYGGAPMPRQIQEIKDGAQVVVGTPGRVLDHLKRGSLDPKTIRVLVLDESDEMLSMGFLPQITEVLSHLPESRQTLLFSATLPPDVQRIAETRLRNPQFITLSGDQVGALEIQHYVYLSRGDKLAELLQVLEVEDPESAIIFCNTRDETKRVAAAMQQHGFEADWLNADLSQADREKVMAATRRGALRFLVCTDVAARGIDISHLTHVINYDFPETAEQYVHRTGRTGRAGRTGTAIALLEPSDIGNLYYLRLTYKIRPIERVLPSAQDRKTREETDLVNMFVDAFTKQAPAAGDLALARRLLTHENAEIVVAGLVRDHLGALPSPTEQATAARRARPPRPVPEEEEKEARPPRRERPTGTPARERPAVEGGLPGRAVSRRTRRGKREAEAPAAEPSQPAEPAEVEGEKRVEQPASKKDIGEVYINVGRRDGARASDFYALLDERAGLGIDEMDYVNVRQRHCFIGVRTELVGRVVTALDGATIAGREARAEPARERGRDEHPPA